MPGSFQYELNTNASSIPRDKRIHISGLFDSLPASISKEDQRAVADYVVALYGQPEGLSFTCSESGYKLSKRPRGYSSIFADARGFRYVCTQKYRVRKASTLPYKRTRNRRPRVHLVDCKGSIIVAFPPNSPEFDISFESLHDIHQGREQFGVPPAIRQWIKDHPISSPIALKEEILRAIKRGDIKGVSEQYLNGPNIHYWWSKIYRKKTYISKDPWENMAHMLEQHQLVFVPFLFTR
jgi:hypothetical protein